MTLDAVSEHHVLVDADVATGPDDHEHGVGPFAGEHVGQVVCVGVAQSLAVTRAAVAAGDPCEVEGAAASCELGHGAGVGGNAVVHLGEYRLSVNVDHVSHDVARLGGRAHRTDVGELPRR